MNMCLERLLFGKYKSCFYEMPTVSDELFTLFVYKLSVYPQA